MNKVKLLSIVTIILLLSNLILVVFIIKNKPGRGEGPKDYIIEKLNFDDKQIEEYNKLIKVHRSEIRQHENRIHELKSNLYAGLNSKDELIKDSLIKQIAVVQMSIEVTHCKHFEAIKQLCQPSQMEAYNALLLEMSELFSQGKKPGK